VLLDTHALLWLVTSPEILSEESLIAIGEAQEANKVFVSPITAWELAIAVTKKNNAPDLGNLSVKDWYNTAIAQIGAKVVPVGTAIALQSADMIAETNHKDPGDCYIISTARYKKVPVVTRDGIIRQIGATGFVDVIVC
jgi:PIN domain nuclease of toxin-antitoxin system